MKTRASFPIDKEITNRRIESDTTFRIIPSKGKTFGYEIVINKKTFIRQLTIPGMPGLYGFKKKKDAVKVAKLVITKLNQGMMPPTIEKKEMDKLKILY